MSRTTAVIVWKRRASLEVDGLAKAHAFEGSFSMAICRFMPDPPFDFAEPSAFDRHHPPRWACGRCTRVLAREAKSMTSDESEAAMKLPSGKMCSDCRSFKRCEALIGITGRETSCDWYPSKFGEPSGAAS